MSQLPPPTEEPTPQRGGHYRRPPLAEIDSWELWQAWRRGERDVALPWVGLLAGFCVVLAAMYAFFFFTTSASGDTIAQVVLTFVFVAFLFALWRRISPRRDFALMVVASIVAVSGFTFVLWLALYRLSGWNPCAAFTGIMALGFAGIAIGLPSLNAIARRQEESET
jgi:hypothetical protein